MRRLVRIVFVDYGGLTICAVLAVLVSSWAARPFTPEERQEVRRIVDECQLPGHDNPPCAIVLWEHLDWRLYAPAKQ